MYIHINNMIIFGENKADFVSSLDLIIISL